MTTFAVSIYTFVYLSRAQGDPIIRPLSDNFPWAIFLTEEGAHIRLLFPRLRFCINIYQKWLGYILGDFSQTHPVTLVVPQTENTFIERD
jgi:hypothetical protein